MGLKNMAEVLEEVVARVLGDCLAEGYITKIADDLIIGGDSVQELLSNWEAVLKRLSDNNLSLSPEKTIICPATINVIGWIWKQGRLEVDQHRINPLTTCPKPSKVKQMRSFIGAVRAFSRCYQGYSKYLAKLEDEVAGKESSEKIIWTDELGSAFSNVQSMLRNPTALTLPHPNDQLVVISDGSNSPASVGSTLYVSRDDKLFPAGFFSAKLKKNQIMWLACEIEAVGISLSINAFSNFIRESKHQTKFLTDSKACVEAFEKMSKGGFSLSPRISSFLLNLNAINVSIHHTAGANIKLTDFSSRNPIQCQDSSCQVCRFIKDHMDIAVHQITAEEVEKGDIKMPFYNKASWKIAQQSDQDLNRVYAQLKSGTRPGRKERDIKAVRRYFQVASISTDGVLIHRRKNLYGSDFELIIIPQNLAPGLISALHLHLCHPTKGQMKRVWNRYFFAINSDTLIDDCTHSCSLCSSLKKLPRELFQQSTSSIPNVIGKSFSADVIRREKQKLLILIDIFSSFIVGLIIPNEQRETLQQALIQLSSNYKHVDGCSVKVDSAPGFKALRNDTLLESIGIKLDFGRVKNKNKIPVVDKAIQDLEGEIKRLAPEGGAISTGTLAIAISHLNDRIRSNGLSAKEVILKRDSVTNDSLTFKNEELQSFKYQKRLQNHPHSEKSKARGGAVATDAIISEGDIIHVKDDGTKHKARDFYLVTNVDHENSEAQIQKFAGSRLGKKYVVKFNEVYLASVPSSNMNQNRNKDSNYDDDDDDGVSLLNETEEPLDEIPEQELRKSTRNRKTPEWLATKEIQRIPMEK